MSSIRSLSLAEYVELFADVPLPNDIQRRAFTDYVAHAHSWYKHLPLCDFPGTPFHFFLDKDAGHDRVRARFGKIRSIRRQKRGFHYSALPTDMHTSRFGCLGFSCNRGTTVVQLKGSRTAIPGDKVATVLDRRGRLCFLPPEIMEAGTTHLTGLIHVSSLQPFLIGHELLHYEDQLEWPQESGGTDALVKILARARDICPPKRELRPEEIVLDQTEWPIAHGGTLTLEEFKKRYPAAYARMVEVRTPKVRYQPHKVSLNQNDEERYPYTARNLAWSRFDSMLYELLAPERKRQYAEMERAIDRVCELISDHR